MDDEQQIILLARENCSYCQMFVPILEYMKETYNFEYLYVDTTKISSKGLKGVLDKLNIDEDSFGTPYLSLVKSGKVIDEIAGYVDEKELLEFLKKNGYAEETSKLPINYINFNEYKDLITSETPQVIVIGQTNCSHCIAAKPALLSIARDYNIKINYFDVTALTTEENSTELIEEFNNSLSYLSESDWGTPLMLIVKNNEAVAVNNGYVSKDNYIEFLSSEGLIGGNNE